MNRNVVVTIIHNEYKDVLLNNKCIRQSMNRIQSKDHRIGTFIYIYIYIYKYIYIYIYIYVYLYIYIKIDMID